MDIMLNQLGHMEKTEFNRYVFLRFPDKVIKREYNNESHYFYYDKNGYVKQVKIEINKCYEYEKSLIQAGYKKK